RFGRRMAMFAPPGAPAPEEGEKEKAVPKRVLEDRQRQSKEEVANAALLHKNGVAFAFSTQGLPADRPWEKFRENLRKVIAEGLPADAALKALTIDAARLLGADKQLGSVAAGKAAHLIVTDGDFHEAKTKVRYVFADGVRFDYTGPQEPTKPDAKKGDDAKKPEKPKVIDPVTKPQATEVESDRKPKLQTGGNVHIKNATVLTVTNGTLQGADILVQKGKITQIGPNLT